MATQGNVTYGLAGSNPSGNQFDLQKLDAAKYISLYDLVNKPDNRDALIKTYGNQGITGFLQLVGATKAVGTNDEVQYWEEERLHKKQKVTLSGAVSAAKTQDIAFGSGNAAIVRLNDILLMADGSTRAIVYQIDSTGFKVANLADANLAALTAASHEFAIIGNLYAQGTDQPSSFIESGITKRVNKFMIMKEVYSVTGSQATNIGWINLGNGDYRWYLKSESDTRQRFMDKREMMMLLGQTIANATAVSSGEMDYTEIDGSEGYFAAIEDRGMVQSGLINTIAEVDDVVKVFDKEGAASEYALYVNRAQDLAIDDMLAAGQLASGTANTTVGAAAFGSFQNSPETALTLGFRSFARGGYTFHKHDWKLLNDPTLLADSDFFGAAVPMAQVADAKTGEKAPALEMNYKAANGYSREMEHWMIGSVLGASNATKDNVEFHYRSEANLITRAANRHLLIKG
jgi:hypothetical protein|tara:strand:- start:23417 stop:24793 length:1377 start_codon:yes stop_codon:yes gene_type:complete